MSQFNEPVVNFDTTFDNLINDSVSTEEKARIGKEILDAFEKHGYVQMKNLGNIDEWLFEFKACGDAFIDLPKEVKEKYTRNFKTLHGYSLQEDEIAEGCPVVHETYDITRIDEMPTEVPNYKECSKVGYENLQALTRLIFISLEMALEITPNYFNERCTFNDYEKNCFDLRFLRYPPLNESQKDIQRIINHIDSGLISMVFQDDVGGLEMKNVSGEWLQAPTDIPNSGILIPGRMMPLVTGGRIKGLEHRVFTRKNETQFRRSVVLFTHFDFDVLLKSESDPIDESTQTVSQFMKNFSKEIYNK